MSAFENQHNLHAADLARQAERKLREDKKSRLARNVSQPCLMSHALAQAGSPDKKTLDAEDFRFHAVREVAYKKHQDRSTPKKGGMKKVFSEIGSLSKVRLRREGTEGEGLTSRAGVERGACRGGKGRSDGRQRPALDHPRGRIHQRRGAGREALPRGESERGGCAGLVRRDRVRQWACNELGVQHMYAAFEKRVDKARRLAGVRARYSVGWLQG